MKFNEWFLAQFGKRPSDKDISQLFFEMEELRQAYEASRRRLLDTSKWEDQRTASFYAWNIKDKNKALKRRTA